MPDVVVHADWGTGVEKCRRAVARRQADGHYELDGTDPVRRAGTLPDRMGIDSDGTAMIGFDFPIGVPRAYANRVGISDFRTNLMDFGRGDWQTFFDVADAPEEISLFRPFYPCSSGSKGQHKQSYLVTALGVDSFEHLRRRCERRHERRGAACPLFWTLGGNQVGKAAIAGWRDLLLPALQDTALDIAVWPFEGSLPKLLGRHRTVVVETYPAEFYRPLGVSFGTVNAAGKSGKRQQHDRRAQRDALLNAAASMNILLTPRLRAAIDDGFGHRSEGEDCFDAVAGTLGMLAVLYGRLSDGLPSEAP